MIAVREARSEDARDVALLHTRSWREHYRGEFRDAFLDHALPDERLEVWRERLDGPVVEQLVLLAHEGDTLVGFVCVYGDHDPVWGSFVDNLHVVSEAMGRGIGASLLRQAGGWLCERWGERGVYLLVLESNAAARAFYERLGARNAGVSTMETHGGAVVRSCRYVWPDAEALASGAGRRGAG